jgi:tetratricopeptide (TPR) repeat protein
MLGDFEAELETARALEELGWKAPFSAKYFVGRALAALGRADGVEVVQHQLEAMADTTSLAGMYMLAVALELRYHGHLEVSRQAVARAIRWFEERPDSMAGDPNHQAIYGVALYAAERWDEAERVLREVQVAIPSSPLVIGHLGLIAARQGETDAARHESELERIGREDYGKGPRTWMYRARIAAVHGDRSRAVSHLKRAFDEGMTYAPAALPCYQYRFDFEGMADYPPYQELLRPKG